MPSARAWSGRETGSLSVMQNRQAVYPVVLCGENESGHCSGCPACGSRFPEETFLRGPPHIRAGEKARFIAICQKNFSEILKVEAGGCFPKIPGILGDMSDQAAQRATKKGQTSVTGHSCPVTDARPFGARSYYPMYIFCIPSEEPALQNVVRPFARCQSVLYCQSRVARFKY